MALNELFAESQTEKVRVRNEPIQARSNDRISALLDAAAIVVDEVGIERLTTALVAEKAGASIGTVYRYFPDRIAVLTALSTRATERFLRRFDDNLREQQPSNWWEALLTAFNTGVETHRSEVGYTSVRLGDLVSFPERDESKIRSRRLAQMLSAILVERFHLPAGTDLLLRVELAVTVADGLLVRAFLVDRDGDATIIQEGEKIIRSYLTGY